MATPKNTNLSAAKKAKQDEFYTELSDISEELRNYKDHFKGKTVLLNCDDPQGSKFYIFFALKFEEFGLKKLIATHYKEEGASYKLEVTSYDAKPVETPLLGNGDFRSSECIDLLRQADIVVTNPPFSLFREFIAQLIQYDKKFLVIGSLNAITYKEIFPLIRENKLWLGVNNGAKSYRVPDDYEGTISEVVHGVKMVKLGNTGWFTNLEHHIRQTPLALIRDYEQSSADYKTYDNYDAIDVGKVVDIPYNYSGAMGVPITFLIKYSPAQFEILNANDIAKFETVPRKAHGLIKDKEASVDGVIKYARIVIRHKI